MRYSLTVLQMESPTIRRWLPAMKPLASDTKGSVPGSAENVIVGSAPTPKPNSLSVAEKMPAWAVLLRPVRRHDL